MLNDKIQRVLSAEQEAGEAGGGSKAEKRATATKANKALLREEPAALSRSSLGLRAAPGKAGLAGAVAQTDPTPPVRVSSSSQRAGSRDFTFGQTPPALHPGPASYERLCGPRALTPPR